MGDQKLKCEGNPTVPNNKEEGMLNTDKIKCTVQKCVVDFPVKEIPNAKPSDGCNAVDNRVTLGVTAVDNMRTSCNLECAEGYIPFPPNAGKPALTCSPVDKTPSFSKTRKTNLDSITAFECRATTTTTTTTEEEEEEDEVSGTGLLLGAELS